MTEKNYDDDLYIDGRPVANAGWAQLARDERAAGRRPATDPTRKAKMEAEIARCNKAMGADEYDDSDEAWDEECRMALGIKKWESKNGKV